MENKKTLFVLLACTLFASTLCGDPVPAPTSPTAQTSSTDPSTDPPTTTPSSTTTPASTTSTTTANPTTSTSTAAPVTTTAAPPTPTPSPVPADGRGNWTVSGDNVTCIIAQMILSAKIDYPLETVNKTGKVTVVVPPTAKAAGQCDNTTQFIKLTWGNNSIQVDFKKNDTTKMYYMSKIDFSLFTDSNVFANISKNFANQSVSFVRVKDDFMINLNHSFRCSREQVLQLKNESAVLAELAISSVQLQAFHTENAVVFGAAQDCELDTPDIVPIAVGCALAALVCVVLVAYLVGRRRSQARGYLSM